MCMTLYYCFYNNNYDLHGAIDYSSEINASLHPRIDTLASFCPGHAEARKKIAKVHLDRLFAWADEVSSQPLLHNSSHRTAEEGLASRRRNFQPKCGNTKAWRALIVGRLDYELPRLVSLPNARPTVMPTFQISAYHSISLLAMGPGSSECASMSCTARRDEETVYN